MHLTARMSLKPNTHRRRRRDSTVELSRVGGVYWALASGNDSYEEVLSECLRPPQIQVHFTVKVSLPSSNVSRTK